MALLLLFSCIVPHISVEHFPFLFIFSLGVPVLVVLNGVFFIYWLLGFKKQLFLSLITLIVGYFVLGSFVVYESDEQSPKLNENTIKVLTFNSLGFHWDNRMDLSELNTKIINFINEQDADILCFQEFDYSKVRSKDFSEFPYKYITFEYGVSSDKMVQAIYSKYRIIKKGAVGFLDTENDAIFSDIIVKNDTIRIYNTHLQSLNVRPGSIKREEPEKLIKRMGNSFVKQQGQAEMLVAHASKTKYKKIICGDFNNSQYSSVYNTIKGEKLDSFMEKGYGCGRTYDFKVIPLRIDFILVDKEFEVLSHKNYDIKLSDHFPIMATLRL